MQRADFIPPQGPPDALHERLRAYVAPYVPDIAARFVGASDEQIGAYARLAGFGDAEEIPRSYMSFLRNMGRDDGGLMRILDVEASVGELVGLYEDWRSMEPETLNPALPVAALYIVGDQLSFDLRSHDAEPALADTSGGTWMRPGARSWEVLAMQAAALHVEARRFPLAFSFSSSPARAEAALATNAGADAVGLVDAFATAHGLEPAWLTDARRHIYLGERYSLFARPGAGQAMLLSVFCRDDEFPRAVGEQLTRVLGLKQPTVLRVNAGHLRPEYA